MNATRRLVVSAFVAVVILSFGYVKADFTFGTPANLGPVVNSPAREEYPCLSPEGLMLYFDATPDTEVTLFDRCDVFVAERKTTKDDWGPPTTLGPNVNSPQADWSPHISADQLELYFTSRRPGGYGGDDIWVTRRASPTDEWRTPVNLGPTVNTGSDDCTPCLSQDSLTLYFTSGWRLCTSHRKTKDAPWEQSVKMGTLIPNSSWESDPAISPDGLVLVFCADYKLWMTTRRTVTSPWESCVQLQGGMNWSEGRDPSFAHDGQTLFFVNSGPAGYGSLDIWQAPIVPICDFNGDGKVDGTEVLIMAEHLGQSDPLCDIGPMPWGDGAVDVNDLIALAGSMGTEVFDPTLIGHWAFDEIEGSLAHGSVGATNVTLIGAPTWQPAGGKIGGALAFDGVNDFGMVRPALNSPGEPFSVFAWVKGGAPGQVVLAQQNGTNWLLLDPAKGTLATALGGVGQAATQLSSQAVITDGQWHRIGIVWDGTNRIVYADRKEVGKDVLPTLDITSAQLFIGTGKALAPSSFWKGLIDDVRIYNRVVKP